MSTISNTWFLSSLNYSWCYWPLPSCWAGTRDTASWMFIVLESWLRNKSMFGIVTALKKNGVLAINRRNADFILKYNPRKHFPLVDDKILTKEFAKDIGLAVPELYAIVEA